MASWVDFPVSLFFKVIMCDWFQSHGSTNIESAVKVKPRYLPPEIWEKIFQRLPVKSLVKCICVCKVWKSIITDQVFILAHLSYKRANNNGNDSLFLQHQYLTHPKYCSLGFALPFQPWEVPVQQKTKSEQHLSVNSDDKEASCLAIMESLLFYPYMFDLGVVGTCNGLVCFVKYSGLLGFGGVVIMNVSIRKYIVLPELNDQSLTVHYNYNYLCHPSSALFGFGFDSKNKDFKVLMLLLSFFERPQVEVYSLAAGKWRRITYQVPSICYCSCGSPRFRKLMFVNGALHWISCGKCNNHHRTLISTFDLTDETFGEIKLPTFWDYESCFNPSLLVRGSRLALAYQKYAAWHEVTYIVCVMKEYGVVDSWDVLFSVGVTQYPHIERVLALTSSEKVVVQTFGQKIIILDEDLNEETIKDLKLENYCVGFAADHTESLFLINQENDNAYVNNEGILDVRFVLPK